MAGTSQNFASRPARAGTVNVPHLGHPRQPAVWMHRSKTPSGGSRTPFLLSLHDGRAAAGAVQKKIVRGRNPGPPAALDRPARVYQLSPVVGGGVGLWGAIAPLHPFFS